jgi:hypothetical protein
MSLTKDAVIDKIIGMTNDKTVRSEDEILACVQRGQSILLETETRGKYGHFAEEDYYEESWVVQIWISVARYYFCTYVKGRRPVDSRRNGRPRQACIHTVIGAEANVVAAQAMAKHLVTMARLAAKEATKKEHKRRPQRDMRPYENKFKRGFGSALAEKVRKMRDDAVNESTKVYDEEDSKTDQYLKEVFGGNLKHPPIAGNGFIDGYLAAETVLLK